MLYFLRYKGFGYKTRWIALLLAGLLLTGCGRVRTEAPVSVPVPVPTEAVAARGGYYLRAAVLHGGAADVSASAYGCAATLDYLRQSLTVDLEAEAVRADGVFSLDGFDMVFLDESLLDCADRAGIVAAVTDFAAAGGGVFVPNGFYDMFPAEFFGAASFVPLEGFPAKLSLPAAGADLIPLQELVADFHAIYPQFQDAEALLARSYGYAMVPDTAQPVVCAADGKTALYALNRYGDGFVFFTNPLLPNSYSAAAFSLAVRDAEQSPFACAAASCNQLLLSRFASYIAKRIYGFSMERTFGAYGAPAMSWELHYEDVTAMAHDAIGSFSALCEAALQPVSFTVPRNPYVWFEQAESLTYVLNRSGAGEGLSFALDRVEGAYSSGTHVVSGGAWLQGSALQNCASYFSEAPWENYRLYPCVLDYDGDGNLDVFYGSVDGKVSYCRGLGFVNDRLVMAEAVEVPGVAVAAFSAPAAADLDGDGNLDLILGGSDGLLCWFRGEGGDGLNFTYQGIFLDTEIPGQCLPCAGDLNGDGVTDLAVGSDQGMFLIYYGQKDGDATVFSHGAMSALTRQCADAALGSWLSPGLADRNGDGIMDLAIGTFPGYVMLAEGDGTGGFTFTGYVTVEDQNYQGNHNLKFGTYCTPVFADLNGDGALDLLCGQLEYGMACPIDSEYFPYRQELQAQLDRAKAKGYYVGVHYLSGLYHSAEREDWELNAHLDALASYGVTGPMGANQHTWHSSSLDPAQTLRRLWEAGLLWESGFEPGGAAGQTPQTAPENAIALPFFLMDGEERTLLVQNCSLLLYRDESFTDLHGKYGMPTLIYYHCDLMYRDDTEARAAVAAANGFREKFGYNFVTEEQLMRAIAAAYNLAVDVTAEDGALVLAPRAVSTEFPLYDENARNAAGVRVSFAEGVSETLSPDAAVWYAEDGAFCLGLDRAVTLRPGAAGTESGAHLRQVNLPAEITADAAGAVLAFQDGGMMEAVVEGKAGTPDEGWTVRMRDGKTAFTKFSGEGETLHIVYQ